MVGLLTCAHPPSACMLTKFIIGIFEFNISNLTRVVNLSMANLGKLLNQMHHS